jgi:hypothetical protein
MLAKCSPFWINHSLPANFHFKKSGNHFFYM